MRMNNDQACSVVLELIRSGHIGDADDALSSFQYLTGLLADKGDSGDSGESNGLGVLRYPDGAVKRKGDQIIVIRSQD